MDLKTAIAQAVKGDERGFAYLYEQTCQKKYYLALQFRNCQRFRTQKHLKAGLE